jgi:hypothetical protein
MYGMHVKAWRKGNLTDEMICKNPWSHDVGCEYINCFSRGPQRKMEKDAVLSTM